MVAAGQRIRTSEIASIEALVEVASACTLCRLCRDRTQVVVGSGDPAADVLVVVEAPGYHEDRAGVLLAGRSGEVFDELLASIGHDRDSVWLTSMVKCRPLAGRSAFPDEIEACEGWLFREIALVRPSIVITFGAQAMRLVTGRPGSLQQAHGQLRTTLVQGRTVGVLPCYHPAAAMHVPALLGVLRADVRAVPGHLRELAAASGGTEQQVQQKVQEQEQHEQPPAPAGDGNSSLGAGDDQLAFPVA